MLTAAGCRVEVCTLEDTILDVATIKRLIGKKCDGVIGQLTEARPRLVPVRSLLDLFEVKSRNAQSCVQNRPGLGMALNGAGWP